MSKQLKNGQCSCWKDVDKQLEEAGANAQLAQSFSFTGHHYLQVKTENLNKSRKAPKTVIASYCPFCGNKLKDPKMGSGGTEVPFNGGLPQNTVRVFVGSWATGDGTKFPCDRCGVLHSRGVNITVINDDVNICRKCSAIIRGELDRAEQVKDGFDDIRFAQ